MQISVKSHESKVAIVMQGRFDFSSHREFRDATDEVMKDDARVVEVDLGGVDYLDSSALGMLLMLRDKAKGVGKEVVLANARGSVKQVIDIASFGKLFALV